MYLRELTEHVSSRVSLQPFKLCVSCPQNHCFHKCHQTIKGKQIDHKIAPLGCENVWCHHGAAVVLPFADFCQVWEGFDNWQTGLHGLFVNGKLVWARCGWVLSTGKRGSGKVWGLLSMTKTHLAGLWSRCDKGSTQNFIWSFLNQP